MIALFWRVHASAPFRCDLKMRPLGNWYVDQCGAQYCWIIASFFPLYYRWVIFSPSHATSRSIENNLILVSYVCFSLINMCDFYGALLVSGVLCGERGGGGEFAMCDICDILNETHGHGSHSTTFAHSTLYPDLSRLSMYRRPELLKPPIMRTLP